MSAGADPAADVRPTEARTAQSASEAAYREIKGWILNGDIPLGMRLGEGRVAARLSTSRTPVREALLRLFAERFVDRHPDGGYRINHPTARAMHELYDVRKALELFAIGAIAGAPDARGALLELRAEWAELRADVPEGDAGFVAIDEEFHTRLAGASGNGELVETLNRVNERIRPVRAHDFIVPGRIAATIDQHVAIVDAALDHGSDASAMLERHIAESQAYVEAAVGRVLERMLTIGEEGLDW
jgi:DNA-binding GntR family transcriptional regulator